MIKNFCIEENTSQEHGKVYTNKKNLPQSFNQTFDQIQWFKSRTLSKNLMNRTVQLKYLKHASEMNQYKATKKVFDRFDDDGNRINYPNNCRTIRY